MSIPGLSSTLTNVSTSSTGVVSAIFLGRSATLLGMLAITPSLSLILPGVSLNSYRSVADTFVAIANTSRGVGDTSNASKWSISVGNSSGGCQRHCGLHRLIASSLQDECSIQAACFNSRDVSVYGAPIFRPHAVVFTVVRPVIPPWPSHPISCVERACTI